MPTFPPDRFDAVPEDLERVGAHRAPKPRGRGWITFAWAALFSGLIVAVGVIGMFTINDRVSFENPFEAAPPAEETSTPVPTVEPTIDPSLDVVVLNGTQTDGLAGQVGDVLAEGGWTVGTRSNADSDIATTTVYYSEPGHEGAAKGVVEALGIGVIEESTAFVIEGAPPRLVVVVGGDYTPPSE
jgi:hypothetical protein